jgi:hypothetical protein
MRKDGAFSRECTKIEIKVSGASRRALVWCINRPANFTGCLPADAPIPRKRAHSTASRRFGAYVAQKLLYWCRSICPGKFFCSSRRFEGGRAGTGQLDWAAAESAEFVNQEKRL